MRCRVYIDGFNLYHGALRPTGHKWLDLLRLSRELRKNDSIECIKYFTARVDNRPDDPDQQRRQLLYWRALDTIPCLQRIEGQFTSHPRRMPLNESVEVLQKLADKGCNVTGVKPIMMEMLRCEEKGTDVNLAVHLVNDAHRGKFDLAVVISADSDLCEAIRVVREEVGKAVFVYKPNPKSWDARLRSAATNVFSLTKAKLSASLFPDTLTDSRGSFSKPSTW